MAQVKISTVENSDCFEIEVDLDGKQTIPRVYELKKHGNRTNQVLRIDQANTGENLIKNFTISEIQVDGTTYDTYEELSAVLAPILFKKGGGSGSGGTDITLEQARQNGNVFEGDVSFINYSKINHEQNGVNKKIEFLDEYGIEIRETYLDEKTGYISTSYEGVYSYVGNENGSFSTSLYNNSFIFGSTIPGSKGIIGNQEFNKQGDRKSFAQLSDVYDSNSYSTDEIKTGGTWIDGKPIYRKVFTGVLNNLGYILINLSDYELSEVIDHVLPLKGSFIEDGEQIPINYSFSNVNESVSSGRATYNYDEKTITLVHFNTDWNPPGNKIFYESYFELILEYTKTTSE